MNFLIYILYIFESNYFNVQIQFTKYVKQIHVFIALTEISERHVPETKVIVPLI